MFAIHTQGESEWMLLFLLVMRAKRKIFPLSISYSLANILSLPSNK
jgi:hypothetical protein